ncbi:CLUMA_CG006676, isoform A [Clunio marinus]|uniref:CLUMA_CG006676, isoform A n=1 Tax=Clunio marinus TaxID=568069 RepID=A0A1J1I3M4_9DIPT|nr:CLUMA_CG006676, isoform A [Clunio marinus]
MNLINIIQAIKYKYQEDKMTRVIIDPITKKDVNKTFLLISSKGVRKRLESLFVLFRNERNQEEYVAIVKIEIRQFRIRAQPFMLYELKVETSSGSSFAIRCHKLKMKSYSTLSIANNNQLTNTLRFLFDSKVSLLSFEHSIMTSQSADS